MNDLLRVHDFLTNALLHDPRGTLAYLVSWLDPLSIGVTDPDELSPELQYDAQNEDASYQALLIARECFPAVYADAIAKLHHGITDQQLNCLLCEGFTREGIAVDSTELVWYGIPLPAYGAMLDEAEFYEQYPLAVPIVRVFGINPDDDPIIVPDDAMWLGAVLAISLHGYDQSQLHRQIGYAIEWLWSISGNSSIDYDFDTLSEIELLHWNIENVAFAREIIQEADSIMTQALQGVEILANQPMILEIVQRNLEIVRTQYHKNFTGKERMTDVLLHHFAKRLNLEWTFVDTGVE